MIIVSPTEYRKFQAKQAEIYAEYLRRGQYVSLEEAQLVEPVLLNRKQRRAEASKQRLRK